MRIVIDIPEVFIAHWEMDRFKDSLLRMKADAESCEMWSGNYEAELCDMLITAFQEAKVVPPHGRLIDADTLMKEITETCKRLYGTDDINTASPTLSAFKYYIGEAPTVIEAEEEA